MTEEQVIELMKTSKSEDEWNDNCVIVKEKCNGYPDFWYKSVIMSGIADEVLGKFGSSTEIKFELIDPIKKKKPYYGKPGDLFYCEEPVDWSRARDEFNGN